MAAYWVRFKTQLSFGLTAVFSEGPAGSTQTVATIFSFETDFSGGPFPGVAQIL
jgi:hypothetical protein